MYVTKDNNRYSECCKKVLYIAPKSSRNIFTNLNPNPAGKARPYQQIWTISPQKRGAGPVAVGTFATIVNPALGSCELWGPALIEFFNTYPPTFRLFWRLKIPAHQQNCSFLLPTAIAHVRKDDQRKQMLSKFKQQTSTAINCRIRFPERDRNKPIILPAQFKLSEKTWLLVSRVRDKQLTFRWWVYWRKHSTIASKLTLRCWETEKKLLKQVASSTVL